MFLFHFVKLQKYKKFVKIITKSRETRSSDLFLTSVMRLLNFDNDKSTAYKIYYDFSNSNYNNNIELKELIFDKFILFNQNVIHLAILFIYICYVLNNYNNSINRRRDDYVILYNIHKDKI